MRTEGTGTSRRLVIQCGPTREGLIPGASVAVEGACLTVVEVLETGFSAEVMEETFQRTTLGTLPPGSLVNLEPALKLNEALEGHLVLGHVDGVGRLLSLEERPASKVGWFEAPRELLRFIAPKGSIAIDGISLTVVEVDDAAARFSVSLLHQTIASTSLQAKAPSSLVNLEVDLLARYLQRLLAVQEQSKVTRELLAEEGFI